MRPKTIHHLFLQSLLSQPCMPLSKAQSIYMECVALIHKTERHAPDPFDNPKDAQAAWPGFRDQLIELLAPLDLSVKEQQDQTNRSLWWFVLVNTSADAAAMHATSNTPSEIAFLKALIEAIALAPSHAFCVSGRNATTLARNLKLSFTAAEATIARFVGDNHSGWLLLDATTKRYLLSPRAIAELSRYLKVTYEDEDEEEPPVIPPCSLCDQIVTIGKFCPSCRRTACHEVCLKKAFKRGKGRCLNQDCGGAWDVNTEWIEIGQGALDPNDDPDMVHLDKKGKRVAAADAEDDIEDVEGTQQNGVGPSQKKKAKAPRLSSPAKKRAPAKGKGRAAAKGKGKGKGRAAQSDEEEEEAAMSAEEEEQDQLHSQGKFEEDD